MMILLLALLGSTPSHAESATYEVPVPQELAPFAKFDVALQDSNKDGELSVQYTLPATLLGDERKVVLSGKIDPRAPYFTLTGQYAKMDCANSEAAVRCQVTHHDIRVNLPGVEKALDAAGVSPQEKLGRLQVAAFVAREGGDLVGVLVYPKETLFGR